MLRAVLSVPFLMWLAGCGEAPREKAAAEPGPRIPVPVLPVTVGDLPSVYEATGTVRARASASLSSKLIGSVREVRVQIGDRVKEGQILIVLDSADLEAALRRAEAAREEIRTTFPEADSGVAAAKASLDLAQVTFNRMQELYSKRSISNQEFDEASARLKAAQAASEIARAKRTQLDARLAQAEQEVRMAQVNRGYAQIEAPYAGLVTAKPAEPGIMATPGAPLMTIEREGAYRVEAAVEESRLGAIRTGQAVSIRFDGAGQGVTGKVSEIVPEVDAASRTGVVKIDLPASPGLKSGVFARALFGMGTRRAIMIPAAAATEHGQILSVLVAENGTARTRLVTLGEKMGDRVEVLSGLNEGEALIFPAPLGVSDGARVEARP